MLQCGNRHLYRISQTCTVNVLKLCELEGVLSVFIREQTKKEMVGRGGVRTGLQIKQATTNAFLSANWLLERQRKRGEFITTQDAAYVWSRTWLCCVYK